MADPLDLTERIEDLANAPQSVSVDGQSVTNPNVKDVMEVQKQTGANAAVRTGSRGLMFNKLVPPGALG